MTFLIVMGALFLLVSLYAWYVSRKDRKYLEAELKKVENMEMWKKAEPSKPVLSPEATPIKETPPIRRIRKTYENGKYEYYNVDTGNNVTSQFLLGMVTYDILLDDTNISNFNHRENSNFKDDGETSKWDDNGGYGDGGSDHSYNSSDIGSGGYDSGGGDGSSGSD